MKTLLSFLILFFLPILAFSQKWVDTNYQILVTNDIPYGTSVDFAGTSRTHLMNIAVPVDDTIPSCGRPLLLAIHGGAFLAGSKDGDQLPIWLHDFAKRGYVTASINYRLGLFQTNQLINCNISFLGIPWNCLNMQDTSEWFRGAYRGMQDAKGALRFLISNASTYHIDPRNVFLVGESAGGIIALETAFLDDSLEKYSQAGNIPNALAPNSIYENQCIQTPGFATSISAMQLLRDDLGSIEGDMNPSTIPYTIKGVGSFYGAMFNNLFTSYKYTSAPRLYMFHQPNDLVVSYDYDRVEAGAAYCATQFPFNCQYIVNRPYLHGSKGIKKMIDNLVSSGIPLPVYQFDSTLNFADCATQLANPTLAGHAVDNAALRSHHMAAFFAPAIDTIGPCNPTSIHDISFSSDIVLYPNPSSGMSSIISKKEAILHLFVSDMNGKLLFEKMDIEANQRIELPSLSKGIYLIKLNTSKRSYFSKLVKI